jgi:hypothetical protein
MANKSDKSESNININQGRVIGNIGMNCSVGGSMEANITNSNVSINESSNNPERKNSELDELLLQIEKFIENDTSLSKSNKNRALKKVKMLQTLTQESLNDDIKENIYEAFTMLKTTISEIANVTELIEKLSSVISPFLPLP